METRQEARSFPRGDLRLVVCEMCGFIFNASFVPELVDYTLPYESSQDFSPRFRVFKQELIDHLISKYDLSGKEILEIGCGDASFLEALCEQAGARGFGIDPNFDLDRLHERAAIRGVREFYGPDQVALTGNLICCRHTLEHIQPVGEFVALARQSASLTSDAVVFFEIPDTERILDEGAFWDVYYEHCSYFTLSSLGNLFRSKGFDVLRLDKGYDDQYLL
ncbi:MAG: class I SAM-dependent methyltransferase, partial [Acidimicrobiia bacterium]